MPVTELLETDAALVAARREEIAALYEAVTSRSRLDRAGGREERGR
jgi:hypothetical protein